MLCQEELQEQGRSNATAVRWVVGQNGWNRVGKLLTSLCVKRCTLLVQALSGTAIADERI